MDPVTLASAATVILTPFLNLGKILRRMPGRSSGTQSQKNSKVGRLQPVQPTNSQQKPTIQTIRRPLHSNLKGC